MNSDDFSALKLAMEKLQLTDPAVTIAADTKYFCLSEGRSRLTSSFLVMSLVLDSAVVSLDCFIWRSLLKD
jgi:hypothetical protein